MLTFILRFVVVELLIVIVIRQFLKKSFTNLRSNLRTLSFLYYAKLNYAIYCRTRFFRLNSIAIFFWMLLYTMCIFSIINCKFIFVSLYLRTLIWVFNIVSQILTTLRKCFNIINFNILFNISNKAIDLYVFVLK